MPRLLVLAVAMMAAAVAPVAAGTGEEPVVVVNPPPPPPPEDPEVGELLGDLFLGGPVSCCSVNCLLGPCLTCCRKPMLPSCTCAFAIVPDCHCIQGEGNGQNNGDASVRS